MKKIFVILFILLAPSLPISLQAEEKSRHYNTYEIKTTVEAQTYDAIVYEPKLTKIKAMLYISPTIGTWDSIEGANAQFFSKHGYIVVVPYPYKTEITNPHPDMDRLDSDYYRSVTSAISFINLVTDKFKLPETLPVFALGASQGGINTVMITSYVPRITAAWFAVAGGNLPHIYAYSDVTPIVKFRQNHMNDLGIADPAAYEKYLAAYLKNDPAISCKQIRVPFHQVIATHDTSVPTVTQELLVKECPPHEVDRKNVMHSGGTMSTVTEREKIKRFFEKYL